MAISSALLQKGLLTNFLEAYEGAQVSYDKVATTIQSSARSESYAWLGSVPGLREMKGERVPKKLLDYNYTLVNKTYEGTIEVDVDDLEDDQTGQYGIQAKNIGQAARTFPDELLFRTLIPAGNSTVCYDGQNYFDTDHPIGETGSTQSNLITTALAADSFNTARGMLRRMLDDQGRPTLNNNADLLLVIPPELESTAQSILEADINANGSTNIYKGNARILVSNWLTDTNNWYLLNTAGTIKPFIVQERLFKPLQTLGEGSQEDFMRRKQFYGTLWRGNAGYGLYQKAVASIVA